VIVPPLDLPYSIVVVGASWGGLHALSVLVAGLPAEFAVPLVLVQHRSRDAHSLLGELLQDHTPLTVCEVDDKQPIARGFVYLAPADYHLLVEEGHFALTVDEPVRFSRPSIDVTFSSAADAFGPRVVGVALTGANEDGAAGLRRIVDRGGRAVVQDPESAEVRTMPAAALRSVPSADVVALEGIAGRLVDLVYGGGSAGRPTPSEARPRPPRPTDPAARPAPGAQRPPDPRP
jgi:two-component system chemotaxis response regulator CheB